MPLYVGGSYGECRCLKMRHFEAIVPFYIRQSGINAVCSQDYPQKMGTANFMPV